MSIERELEDIVDYKISDLKDEIRRLTLAIDYLLLSPTRSMYNIPCPNVKDHRCRGYCDTCGQITPDTHVFWKASKRGGLSCKYCYLKQEKETK